MGDSMEKESCHKNRAVGIIVAESWVRNQEGEIMEGESRTWNHGRGTIWKATPRRNHGEGIIGEEAGSRSHGAGNRKQRPRIEQLWGRNCRGEIRGEIWEASGRHRGIWRHLESI